MQINKAEFKCSSERISQVPKDSLKDIAFIGRSNVGKSSLINMLTGRQGLAKVSGICLGYYQKTSLIWRKFRKL